MHPAAQQIHALGHRHRHPRLTRDNLAVALHGAQPLTQRVKITLLTQPELLGNVPNASGASAASITVRITLATGNRVRVAVFSERHGGRRVIVRFDFAAWRQKAVQWLISRGRYP